jgi:hypothetical protein
MPRRASDILYEEIGRETPQAGEDYLRREIESLVSRSMPQFQGRLQDLQEGSIRRGLQGGLPTSYEGDLASAFHQNIADTAGGLSFENYQGSRNRLLDLLSGQRDYETAERNAKRKRRAGLLGGILGAAGGVGGFLLGGPAGAYAGAQAGSGLGAGLGG